MLHAMARARRRLITTLAPVLLATAAIPTIATADTAVQGESMRLRPSGRVAPDAGAGGGKAVILRRRSSALKQVQTGQVQKLQIVARGDRCPSRSRAPRMIVRVDGRIRGRIDVASATWSRYAVPVALAPGRHRLKVSFTNQRRARRCSRALRIDAIVLEGPAATPAARTAPAVPLGPQPPALFVGDFETGDHRQWGMVQETSADRIQVVQAPARQGRFASRHEVRAGDDEGRAELAETSTVPLRTGSDLYFGWSTYFTTDFPSPDETQGHSSVVQWKGEGSGPPPTEMTTRMQRIGLRVDNVDLWSTPLTRGVWHDFVVHMRFSSDPRVGFAEITHNGVPQRFAGGQSRIHYATLKSGTDSYLKLGYYRSTMIEKTGVVYHDAMRVGTSAEAVVTR